VTITKNSELANLERIADQERVSLSAVVHRILFGFLRGAQNQ